MVHRSGDMWALGIMLYELVYSKFPTEFESTSNQRKFLMSDAPIALPQTNSVIYNIFNQVMSSCLNRDPRQRPAPLYLLSKAIDLIQSLEDSESIKTFLVILVTLLKEAHRKEDMLKLMEKRMK